jgi:hypothetical protein
MIQPNFFLEQTSDLLGIDSHGNGGNFCNFFFGCLHFPRNCEAKVCSGITANCQSRAQDDKVLGFSIQGPG